MFPGVVSRRFVLFVVCVLLRARCLLFVVPYILSVFVLVRLLLVACWCVLFVVVRCVLFVAWCLLFGGACFSLLFVVCGVCCLLSVARRSLIVECCVVVVLLLVVRCLLLFVVCL